MTLVYVLFLGRFQRGDAGLCLADKGDLFGHVLSWDGGVAGLGESGLGRPPSQFTSAYRGPGILENLAWHVCWP